MGPATEGALTRFQSMAISPVSVETVFKEIQGIVSTLKLKEDQKMPQSWVSRLKELLRGAP